MANLRFKTVFKSVSSLRKEKTPNHRGWGEFVRWKLNYFLPLQSRFISTTLSVFIPAQFAASIPPRIDKLRILSKYKWLDFIVSSNCLSGQPSDFMVYHLLKSHLLSLIGSLVLPISLRF